MSAAAQTPTLTTASNLRTILSQPGVKWSLREYFEYDRAEHLLRAPQNILCHDHRKKLARFLRAAKMCADGRWYVDALYDFSTKKNPVCKERGIGRVYANVTLGTLPVDVRSYIVTDCIDMDVANSHPTCLLHACKEAGLEHQTPCLAQYVYERAAVLAELEADYGLKTREEQKEAVIAVLNGSTPPNAGSGKRFLHNMQREAAAISTWLMADQRYAAEAAAAKNLKGKVTFLHYLMARIELDVLISLASYLQGQKCTIRCLIYDGVLVEAEPERTDPALYTDMLRGAEAHVLAETRCSIKLAIKSMKSSYVEKLKDVPSCLVDDDYAAGKFVTLYGKEKLMYVQGSTHIFNKTTGLWEDSDRTLRVAVHSHKEQLVFGVGKSMKKYGGCASDINKMLSLVPNHIDVNDNFCKDNLDSSQGKLLFSNGIYDFHSDEFTLGFDHRVVFAGRIDRDFDRNGTPEAKAHITKMIWRDPYTAQQIEDGVPLCEQIALARAVVWRLPGRARKAYILVGNTGTGKGVKAAALENSCGSFVGTFDINNFVHNPNNGADAAKQLSWLKQIVDKRIALSSEARTNTVLCGMLLKQVSSGGDTITLRTNHKDESKHINRSTLFMMCNDVPKIQPCDDAVQDRIGGVFDMQVEFKEKPNPFRPDHEKPRDPSLKDKLTKPEYQNAFLSTLLDAYQEYRHAAHVILASVSAGVQEWVTNECGPENLLAEVCEAHLDVHTMQPDQGTYVPFDELYQMLVVDGVGPRHNKVCMSKTKLGKQLTLLSYPCNTRSVGGKKVRVRLGLSLKHEQSSTSAQEELGDARYF